MHDTCLSYTFLLIGYTMHMKNKPYSYIQPYNSNNTSYDFSVFLILCFSYHCLLSHFLLNIQEYVFIIELQRLIPLLSTVFLSFLQFFSSGYIFLFAYIALRSRRMTATLFDSACSFYGICRKYFCDALQRLF